MGIPWVMEWNIPSPTFSQHTKNLGAVSNPCQNRLYRAIRWQVVRCCLALYICLSTPRFPCMPQTNILLCFSIFVLDVIFGKVEGLDEQEIREVKVGQKIVTVVL